MPARLNHQARERDELLNRFRYPAVNEYLIAIRGPGACKEQRQLNFVQAALAANLRMRDQEGAVQHPNNGLLLNDQVAVVPLKLYVQLLAVAATTAPPESAI